MQVLYARASDRADRFSTYLSSIRQWAAAANNIFAASAAETGGNRHIRFVHSSSCTISVLKVTLPPTADDDFDNTISALKALNYNRTDRKYMIFMDANVICGQGGILGDDQPYSSNANNYGPSYGRSDSGCWNGYTAAHELMHNLGGVQLSARHTSGGWHCIDEHDVMCYSDEPDYPPMLYVCGSTLEQRFDCRDDDYYNTRPAAGSYLATRWNSANNQYIAQKNPYSARQVCGPDYTVTVARHDLGGKGTVYLLYAPNTGYNCSVTIKATKIGTPSSTEAWLLVQGGQWMYDKGNYKYYAGPVRRYAKATCVAYAGGHDGINWTSGFVGCSSASG